MPGDICLPGGRNRDYAYRRCRADCLWRMGEERWRQGEIMPGHAKAGTSGLCALVDPASPAAAAGIVDEIESLAAVGSPKGKANDFCGKMWSGREDSNLRPLPPEDSALPG